MAKFQSKYSVIGSGPFPTDMLRYDESRPAEERDSAGIAMTRDSTEFDNMREITLVVSHDNKAEQRRWVPTHDRWRSFGWQVARRHREGR